MESFWERRSSLVTIRQSLCLRCPQVFPASLKGRLSKYFGSGETRPASPQQKHRRTESMKQTRSMPVMKLKVDPVAAKVIAKDDPRASTHEVPRTDAREREKYRGKVTRNGGRPGCALK